MGKLEQYLLDNNFELDTYYGTNKSYIKIITCDNFLYVRIFSNVGEIVDVEYEKKSTHKYDNKGRVSLPTIKTFDKLKLLIEAL